MSTVTTNALQAYARAASAGIAPDAPSAADATGKSEDFAGLVKDVLDNAVKNGKEAELKSAQHIAGKGELVDVVTALTAAETTLDTIVAVRDRVISAYQEISRMPI